MAKNKTKTKRKIEDYVELADKDVRELLNGDAVDVPAARVRLTYNRTRHRFEVQVSVSNDVNGQGSLIRIKSVGVRKLIRALRKS